jgi:hypothetical protein
MTKMYRKTTCNGCGFTQTTVLSYYLDRKQWNAGHTLAVHNELREKRNDQATEDYIDWLLAGKTS